MIGPTQTMLGALFLTVTTPFGRNGIASTLAMSKSKICLPNASRFFVAPGQLAADLQEIINIHWITEHSSRYQFLCSTSNLTAILSWVRYTPTPVIYCAAISRPEIKVINASGSRDIDHLILSLTAYSHNVQTVATISPSLPQPDQRMSAAGG